MGLREQPAREYGEACEGYESICPFCGTNCRCPYDDKTGQLFWAANVTLGHCAHFLGMYQANGTTLIGCFR